MINDLIENIVIYKDGNIKIVFRYQDEYNEAIHFIKEKKYDIINKDF